MKIERVSDVMLANVLAVVAETGEYTALARLAYEVHESRKREILHDEECVYSDTCMFSKRVRDRENTERHAATQSKVCGRDIDTVLSDIVQVVVDMTGLQSPQYSSKLRNLLGEVLKLSVKEDSR